jgi:hypothetical protein
VVWDLYNVRRKERAPFLNKVAFTFEFRISREEERVLAVNQKENKGLVVAMTHPVRGTQYQESHLGIDGNDVTGGGNRGLPQTRQGQLRLTRNNHLFDLKLPEQGIQGAGVVFVRMADHDAMKRPDTGVMEDRPDRRPA